VLSDGHILAALRLQEAGWLPAALAVAAVALLAIAAFYHPQVRAVPRRLSMLPPLLRLSAMLALAAALLKPAILQTSPAARQGPLLVLIDRSASMSATDRLLEGLDRDGASRITAQLVALADSLGLLPKDARQFPGAALAGAMHEMRALADRAVGLKGELDYALLSGRDPQAARAALQSALDELAARASAAARQSRDLRLDGQIARRLAALAEQSRSWRRQSDPAQLGEAVAEIVQRIADAQSSSDVRLHESNQQVRDVCRTLSELSRLQLVEQALFRAPGALLPALQRAHEVHIYGVDDAASGLPADQPLVADGSASALRRAIGDVLAAHANRPPAAVLLFTDGRRVGDEDGPPPTDIPLLAVQVAAGRPRDLRIADVRMPPYIFQGEELSVVVNPRSIGLAHLAGSITVQIGQRQATAPLAESEGRLAPVVLRLPAPTAGLHRVLITVSPQPGEATTANNSVYRWVNVLPPPVRVLLLAGTPTWDWRSLRDALTRTTWVQLHAGLATPGDPLELPAAELARHDVVILCDLPRRALSDEQWGTLYTMVKDQGAGLLLVAGVSLPAEYAGHLLADLLPWPGGGPAVWRTWPGGEPHWRAVPTAAGLQALPLAVDREVSRLRWLGLGGFYRYLAMPALREDASVLLQEQETLAPLLTLRGFGNGRAMFLAMNEAWRWRADGPADLDRFWQETVRCLAPQSAPGHELLPVGRFEAELADLAPDNHLLAEWAAASGGAVVPLEQVDTVPRLLADLRRRPAVREHTLWDSGWLFAFVLGVLSIEWALRKQLGLP